MKNKKDFKKFKDVKQIIYNSVKLYPRNIAFTSKTKNQKGEIEYINHTYTDLLDDINAFGTSLYKLGLKNKKVAVIGYNSYEWAIAHLSNLLGNIVSVPLDKGLQIGELESSLIRSEVEAIVFDHKLEEIMKEIIKNAKTKIKYYICTEKTSEYLYFYDLLKNGKSEIKNGYKDYINAKIDPYKMSILLFTSGTTSLSKAVMLNQNGIATNIYDMQLVEIFYDTDVNIAFLPFHHIFGSTGMLVMLAAGMKTVFPDGLRYIKQNLAEYKVSVFVGVPILIEKMYSTVQKELEKRKKLRLVNFMILISNFLLALHIDVRRKLFKQIIDALGGNMRFIISGGAPLDKKISKWFNSIGIYLVQGYGLTETSPVIAAENSYERRAGSVGKAMQDTEIKIIDKDASNIGEIIVKGPNIMLGYYNDKALTSTVIEDKWFHTGDLGYIDEDGFLFITGRKKDMIVLKNGKKIFPEELELLVNNLEEVQESFIYGLPENNDKNDVKIAVKIVYDEKAIKSKYPDMSKDELHTLLWNKVKEINKTLPMYKYIKDMTLTTEPLIKTSTQKIKRFEELKKVLNEN